MVIEILVLQRVIVVGETVNPQVDVCDGLAWLGSTVGSVQHFSVEDGNLCSQGPTFVDELLDLIFLKGGSIGYGLAT